MHVGTPLTDEQQWDLEAASAWRESWEELVLRVTISLELS